MVKLLKGLWKRHNIMDFIAVQKFVRISPKKLRGVADVARKLTPQDAILKLPFLRKRGSEVLVKVIKSALAGAKQKGTGDEGLIFKEIQIGEGSRLKRGRAASRGRWHPYKRRMSHIRVVLTTKASDVRNIEAGKDAEKVAESSKDEYKEVKTKGKKLTSSVQTVGKALKAAVSGKRNIKKDASKVKEK